MSYKFGWCHTCDCAIVSCTEEGCIATTCNCAKCDHQDLDAIAKEAGIHKILYKDYEHQDLDWLEGKPLLDIAENMARSASLGMFHEDQSYISACAIIAYLAICLIKDGESVWTFKKAKGYSCRANAEYVHMFDVCIPEYPDSRAKRHLDANNNEISGECPNCKREKEIIEHMNERIKQ